MKGGDYPLQSIRGMILSIQMYVHTCRINWKLLSEDDPIFVDLYNVIDNVMKDHTEPGLGKVNSCSLVINRKRNVEYRSAGGTHTSSAT